MGPPLIAVRACIGCSCTDLYEAEEYSGLDIETPEGVKRVYAIGAWAWVWTEVR